MKNVGEFLLGSAIKCISSYANENLKEDGKTTIPSVIFGLIDTIAGNVITDKFQQIQISRTLEKKLSGGNPSEINHDLQRVFKNAAILSIGFSSKMYSIESVSNAELNERTIDKIELYVKENKSDLLKKIEEYPFNETDILDSSYFISSLVKIISPDLQINNSIEEYYNEKLQKYFDLIFVELLKYDDVGFKSFQIWILKELLNTGNKTFENTEKIIESLKSIETGNSLLSTNELYNKISSYHARLILQIENTIKGAIKAEIGNIKDTLREFSSFPKIKAELDQKIFELKIEIKEKNKRIEELEKLINQTKDNHINKETLEKEKNITFADKLGLEKELKEKRFAFDIVIVLESSIINSKYLYGEKKYNEAIAAIVNALNVYSNRLDEINQKKYHDYYFQLIINLKVCYLKIGEYKKAILYLANSYTFSKYLLTEYGLEKQYVIFCEHYFDALNTNLSNSNFITRRNRTGLIRDFYIDIINTIKDCPLKDKKEIYYYNNVLEKIIGVIENKITKTTTSNVVDFELAEKFFLAGNENYISANYEAAIVNYSKAIELFPDLYEAYTNRGMCKDLLYDDDIAAVEDYWAALRINPNCAEAYLNMGVTLFKKGNELVAFAHIGRAEKIDPENSKVYFIRGNLNLQLKKTAEALKDLKKAYEMGETTAKDLLDLIE